MSAAEPASQALRLGIVGAGSWAALAHIPAAIAHPDVALVGVADRDPVRLAQTCDHYGIAGRFDDHHALIGAGLDALVIATPHRSHYGIARDALDAGLHLLIEKPLTVDAAEARDIEARATAAGRHVVVGYVFNHTAGAAVAHAFVQSGRLGDVTLVTGVFASQMETLLLGQPDERDAWVLGGPSAATYGDPAGSGGQGHSQVTHALGLQLWVTGLRPRRVTAFMSNRDAAVDMIDAIAYQLDNGALGTLGATGAIRLGQAEQQALTYYGTAGTLHHDLLTGSVELHPVDGGTRELSPALEGDAIYPRSAPLGTLVRLVHGATDNPSPLHSAVAAVELLDAAYRSAAADGRPVLVDAVPPATGSEVAP